LNKLFSISNWLFLIHCYCQNSIGDLWNTLVPTTCSVLLELKINQLCHKTLLEYLYPCLGYHSFKLIFLFKTFLYLEPIELPCFRHGWDSFAILDYPTWTSILFGALLADIWFVYLCKWVISWGSTRHNNISFRIIYLNFRFTFSTAYYLPLILGKIIYQLIICLLGCKQVGSVQLIIDGDSYQIYFLIILSRFILVHYIGAIVIYTTHPKST